VGSFLPLPSPPPSTQYRDRQDGVSSKDHPQADGHALEIKPTVLVGLHGIAEQDGKQEHERVADGPPPRQPPDPGKIPS
jgi:hypothetical protein